MRSGATSPEGLPAAPLPLESACVLVLAGDRDLDLQWMCGRSIDVDEPGRNHPFTLKRLALNERLQGKEVIGTTFQLDDGHLLQVRHYLQLPAARAIGPDTALRCCDRSMCCTPLALERMVNAADSYELVIEPA